jgi:transcriptional regulator with XRE-family HTH domain
MLKSLHTRQYALLLEELRAARQAVGLTQVALAERLDMTQSDVSKCERGTRRLDVIELREWSQALGLGLVEFSAKVEERLLSDVLLRSPTGRKRSPL